MNIIFSILGYALVCALISGLFWLVRRIISSFNRAKYVDLGLPSGTLWADRNVGAENDCAMGELRNAPKGNPQIPNVYDFLELIDAKNCTWEFKGIVKGEDFISGYKVTSKKNGSSIFLPYYDALIVGDVENQVPMSIYWSSEVETNPVTFEDGTEGEVEEQVVLQLTCPKKLDSEAKKELFKQTCLGLKNEDGSELTQATDFIGLGYFERDASAFLRLIKRKLYQ